MSGSIDRPLESTGDPAYAVDERGRVSGWNAPAERLLGYARGEVEGRLCHEVLRGLDVFGNSFCEPDCPLLVMARRREPARHFEMDLLARDGTRNRVACFVVVVPRRRPGTFSIVHLLEELERPGQGAPGPRRSRMPHLTNREREVLRLLSKGHTTREMAEVMTVSTGTVRKHVQNLLRKLGARNRLTALLNAFEMHLL